MTVPLPVLYSFRRCPYAMRARMALAVSATRCALREVVLRHKPAALIAASQKATVPVLVETSGNVLEESIEIMLWALTSHDPEDWLARTSDPHMLPVMRDLIAQAETDFKPHLDRYKYTTRYEDSDPLHHRTEAVKFIRTLENQLGSGQFLFAQTPKLADIAIFPFIRQFANTDRDWFAAAYGTQPIGQWLNRCLDLPVFTKVMEKYPPWQDGDKEPVFAPRL